MVPNATEGAQKVRIKRPLDFAIKKHRRPLQEQRPWGIRWQWSEWLREKTANGVLVPANGKSQHLWSS